MAVIGELATLITAKTKPFTDGLKVATTQADKFSNGLRGRLGNSLGGLSTMLGGVTTKIAALGGAMGAGGIVIKSLKLASAAEDMETSYATYLKSMTKAKATLAELQKYSAATPFEATEIKEAGKQLLAFGFQAEHLMTVIKVIGDLSAGSQKPMADFVDILGKIKASGVASMGDVNRLADRGVPIFQELAKTMGVATSEVRTLVGASKVGFDDVWRSLHNVVSEGGLFEGAVAKMAETTSGKFSSLKDAFTDSLTGIGSAMLEGLDVKGITTSLTDLVTNYRQNIVDGTTNGVAILSRAVKEVTAELTKITAAISYMYHGTADAYWSTVDWMGRNIPGASAPEARRNALEHRSAMYESQVTGIETMRQQYLRAGDPWTAPPKPQQAAPQQQGPQSMPEVWAQQEQQAREQQRAYMLQLREQQRTNELLRQQNQLQAQPQSQVVESF